MAARYRVKKIRTPPPAPKVGLIVVVSGLTLASGKVVQAFSDTVGYASEINIVGQVNRITD